MGQKSKHISYTLNARLTLICIICTYHSNFHLKYVSIGTSVPFNNWIILFGHYYHMSFSYVTIVAHVCSIYPPYELFMYSMPPLYEDKATGTEAANTTGAPISDTASSAPSPSPPSPSSQPSWTSLAPSSISDTSSSPNSSDSPRS